MFWFSKHYIWACKNRNVSSEKILTRVDPNVASLDGCYIIPGAYGYKPESSLMDPWVLTLLMSFWNLRYGIDMCILVVEYDCDIQRIFDS
jgi:hypothetical protein